MDPFDLTATSFCEQCGLHRDQLGDESIAPFRDCATCGRAVCPNCWNLVADACLRCVPFSLPVAAEEPIDPVFLATAAALAAPPAPAKPKRPRLRKGKPASAADAVVTAVVAEAAVEPAPAPMVQPSTTARTPVPQVEERTVEWPDRSVEWQVRPGMVSLAPALTTATPVAEPPATTASPKRAGDGRSRRGRLAGGSWDSSSSWSPSSPSAGCRSSPCACPTPRSHRWSRSRPPTSRRRRPRRRRRSLSRPRHRGARAAGREAPDRSAQGRYERSLHE